MSILVWNKHKSKNHSTKHDITIAIAGSMTVEPLEAYLGTFLLDKGYINPKFVTAPFNQTQQLCSNYKAVLNGVEPEVIIILWRVEDILKNVVDFDTAEIDEALQLFKSSIYSLQNSYSGTIIASLPPFPSMLSCNYESLRYIHNENNLLQNYMQKRKVVFEDVKDIQFIDLQALITKIGYDNAHDFRKWLMYKQPWTENLWSLIGKQVGRIINAQKNPTKKCIVLDADNTLWGGVIGEDGIGGIILGDDFPANAYKEFQKYILHLHNSGIMLAIASKNNESDFFEAFDNHSGMILKRDHFLSFQVNWGSKVESIKKIASELKISTESMVFIDDSAKEIAEVQERLPEVVCFQVPDEIADYPYMLAKYDCFDLIKVTEEDLRRNAMMRVDQSRKNMKEGLTEDEFKNSLSLEMRVFEAQSQHLSRIVQLINKTNQFNLTTIRRNQQEVEMILKSSNHKIIGMELSDRFGDYGLVGVTIIEFDKNKCCIIDTLLMSCRVLGRDAEKAFIAYISDVARNNGCTSLIGKYIETYKNSIVKDLYKIQGFTYNEQNMYWITSVDTCKCPEHIKIISPVK